MFVGFVAGSSPAAPAISCMVFLTPVDSRGVRFGIHAVCRYYDVRSRAGSWAEVAGILQPVKA